jgi:Ca2+-binding EF-hand superfamily protein
MPTQLTQEEIDSCRDAFLRYDKDRSGSIDQWELKEVLEGSFASLFRETNYY